MRLHRLPDEIPNFIAKRLLKRRGPVGLICVELVQAFLDLWIASGNEQTRFFGRIPEPKIDAQPKSPQGFPPGSG